MTAQVEAPATAGVFVNEHSASAWEGFTPGPWQDSIDVRGFIFANFTPYEGDSSFLAGPTEKTLRVWDTLEKKYLSIERKNRVYDVDTKTPAEIDAFPEIGRAHV